MGTFEIGSTTAKGGFANGSVNLLRQKCLLRPSVSQDGNLNVKSK